jgi:hypothetical protein
MVVLQILTIWILLGLLVALLFGAAIGAGGRRDGD